jgi:phage-related protein
MAVVGEAFIVVRPITTGFASAVKRDLDGFSAIAGKAGKSAGGSFAQNFRSALDKESPSFFSQQGIARALQAQKAWASFTRTAYFLQTGLSVLASSVGSLIGGIVSLGSVALAAAPSVVALGGAFAAIGIGAATAKLALSGVGAAVSKLNKQQTKAAKDTTAQEDRLDDAIKSKIRTVERNKEAILQANKEIADSTKDAEEAQREYNLALEAGVESIQQLGFDAEDAALAEQKAALELEKARENLQRVQDLPPNSRARKEAELAYAEAELNLRKAKDRNGDLAKEQERLAKTGPAGVEAVIEASQRLAAANAKVLDSEDAKNKKIIEGAQAEKDAQDAIDRANRDLEKAKKDVAADDPLAGLTESQKEFAKFISSLKPKVDEIKEAAAGAFLPKLQEGIEIVAEKGFPVIKQGVTEVGDALGDASISIAKAITESGNLKDLATVFTNAADSIRTIGDIIGNVWGIILSVLIAVDPLLDKFLGWIEKWTGKWEAILDTEEGQKKLTDFFNEAGRVAAEIGKVFGNAASGIGNIVKANTGPGTGGQILLDYFKDITQAFKDFSGSAEGQATLKDYFAATAENSKSILSTVGAFVKEILKAGADPNIKVFWDTLKQGAPIFGEILAKSNEAGPALARLIVAILRIVSALTDGGSMKTFFNVLATAAETLASVLENSLVQKILAVVGSISGFLLAFGALKGILMGVVFVLQGLLLRALSFLLSAFNFLATTVRIVVSVFNALKVAMLANPIGAVVVAIVALIAIFVILYKKNEAFRELVQTVWDAIKNAIGVAVDFIIGYFKTIIEFGAKLWGWIFDALEVVWNLVFAYFKTVYTIWKTIVEVIIGIGLIIWDFLYDKIQAVWELVSGWWNDTILPFITGIVETVAEFGAAIWDWIYDKIEAVWTTVKDFWDKTIYPFVSGIVKGVKDKAGAIWDFISGGISTAWGKVTGYFTNTIYPFITGIKNKITEIASGMWDGLKSGLAAVINFIITGLNKVIDGINFLIKGANAVKIGKDIALIQPIPAVKLAKGGIIPAVSGGTLATIGEAGRPERVEPLDPDGLSKRDKAMIQLLAGNSGGGPTINVYPSQGMNENDLAEIVSRKIAFAMRRGANI